MLKRKIKKTKILGLDVGDKKIGVAVSDFMWLTAQGRENIIRQSDKKAIDQLVGLIITEKIDTVVVGLPKNMDNTLGSQSEKTVKFIDKLKKKLKYTNRISRDISFVYFDERLTSKAAETILLKGDVSRQKRKKVIDRLAAVIILQNYLDSL